MSDTKNAPLRDAIDFRDEMSDTKNGLLRDAHCVKIRPKWNYSEEICGYNMLECFSRRCEGDLS